MASADIGRGAPGTGFADGIPPGPGVGIPLDPAVGVPPDPAAGLLLCPAADPPLGPAVDPPLGPAVGIPPGCCVGDELPAGPGFADGFVPGLGFPDGVCPVAGVGDEILADTGCGGWAVPGLDPADGVLTDPGFGDAPPAGSGLGEEPAIGSGFGEGPTPGLGVGDGPTAEVCEVDGCEPAVARPPPSGRLDGLVVTVLREPGPGVTVLWVAVPVRLPTPESIPASGRVEPGFVVAGPSDADRWVAGRDVGGWLVSNRVGSGVVCPGFAPPESGALAAVAPDLGVVVPVPPDPVAVEWEVPAVAVPGLGELTFEALVFVAPGFGGLMLEVLVLVAPAFIGVGCGVLVFVAPGFGGLMFAVFGFGGLMFAVFGVFGFVGLTFAGFAALGFAGPGAGVPDLVGPAFIGSGGGTAADRPGAGAFEALEDGVVDMGWPSAGARLEAGGPGFGRSRLGAGRRASERLRLGTLMIASHAGPRP